MTMTAADVATATMTPADVATATVAPATETGRAGAYDSQHTYDTALAYNTTHTMPTGAATMEAA